MTPRPRERPGSMSGGRMSKSFLARFKPDTLLPSDLGFIHTYGNDSAYYRALGFFATLIRDSETSCSIYVGDPYDDYVDDYINDLSTDRRADFRNHLAEIKRCAKTLQGLIPDGVFERLDFHQVDAHGVSYIGVLHATDYR